MVQVTAPEPGDDDACAVQILTRTLAPPLPICADVRFVQLPEIEKPALRESCVASPPVSVESTVTIIRALAVGETAPLTTVLLVLVFAALLRRVGASTGKTYSIRGND
jgi:hypothetical protein